MLIKNCIIAFFIFCSIHVCAKNTWIIEKIQFDGLHSVVKNELLKQITWNTRKKISENDVKNSIQSLFRTGYFEDIKAVYVNHTIIFYVKERPLISSIDIIGNKTINQIILNQYLNQLDIVKGKLLNPFMINVFTTMLEKYYQDLGKYQTQIKIVKTYSVQNTVCLKIMISEGTSKGIKNIKIIGNKVFSNQKIMSFFHLQCDYSWWNIFDECFFSNITLENNLNALTNFYLNQGYFYFHINSKKIDFTSDKKNVRIRVYIDEGEKYKISKFFINSNLLHSNQYIKDMIHIKKGEFYNKEKIDLLIDNIKKMLSDNGYINAQIHIYPKINNFKKTIILNFNIDVQKRYFVRRILFRGNTITQDVILRREILQKENSYFSRDLIELGKKALEKTQYFSSVKVFTNFISSDSNTVDVIYDVKENQTGSFNFSVGYGIDNGLSTNILFSQDNLLGSGNSIKSRILKNSHQRYADIAIIYPYFAYNNTSFKSRIFYDDAKYSINTISNLKKSTSGVESNLSLFVNNNNRFNFGLGYTHNSIINTKSSNMIKNALQSSDEKFFKNTVVNDYTINYEWIYDNLKYFNFPISGNKTSFSGKHTIPGSDNTFYKLMLDSIQYIPLNTDNTLIFLIHTFLGGGNLFNTTKLPFYENFYSNNVNYVRGFQLNTIGPKTIYEIDNLDSCTGYKKNGLCESVDSIGGNAMVIGNIELIVPIPLIDQTNASMFRTSFFLDAGSVWDTKWKNIDTIRVKNVPDYSHLNNIYFSSGIALRWISPIGPLVFSYAYPIFPQKNQNYRIEPFQFNIGKNW